jgi:hypothetical protein
MHRLAQMHSACAHLAVEHRGLRLRDFLLRRDLALAIGNKRLAKQKVQTDPD